MQKSKLLFSLLCLLGVMANGYAQRLEISGQVTNDSDVEGIHVLNKTAGINTVTDQNGYFEIAAGLNDTIWFASLRYMLEEVVVTPTILKDKQIVLSLLVAVNELDEVRIGNTLSGDLRKDAADIPVEKPLNFDDVGIPGFKGTPEEKIAPIVPGLGTITSVDIESLYKHLSGYYKKLRLRRKWEGQNVAVLQIIGVYGESFFSEAYNIPGENLYDFLLFCTETSSIQNDMKRKNFASVLAIFKDKSEIYTQRLESKKD
ncbi:MAG: hypothetical protein ABJP74_03040 [Gilvibacter sp.]